jgi:ABC-type sulfate/molybdate transport systems ATPase subunit
LVLDEPVQGVDFNGQNELYGLIGQLRSSLNCGIVMVSHDLQTVLRISRAALVKLCLGPRARIQSFLPMRIRSAAVPIQIRSIMSIVI